MKKVFALFSIITLTLLFMTSCVSMEKSDNSDNSIVNDNGKVLFELNDDNKKTVKTGDVEFDYCKVVYVYIWGHRVGGTSVDITEQKYYSTKLVQYDNYFEISYCMYSSSSYEIRTLVYSNQIAGYEFTV